RPLLFDALKAVNAAGLFLELYVDPEKADEALSQCLEQARPQLADAGGWQHLLLCLPNDPASNEIREMIARRLPALPTSSIGSESDVVLHFEAAHIPLRQAVDLLIGDDPEHAEIARKVLTRIDVPWSFFSDPARQ